MCTCVLARGCGNDPAEHHACGKCMRIPGRRGCGDTDPYGSGCPGHARPQQRTCPGHGTMVMSPPRRSQLAVRMAPVHVGPDTLRMRTASYWSASVPARRVRSSLAMLSWSTIAAPLAACRCESHRSSRLTSGGSCQSGGGGRKPRAHAYGGPGPMAAGAPQGRERRCGGQSCQGPVKLSMTPNGPLIILYKGCRLAP